MFKLPPLLISAFAILVIVGAGCEATSQASPEPMQPVGEPAAMQKTEPVPEGRMKSSDSTASTSVMTTNNTLMRGAVTTEGQMKTPEVVVARQGNYEAYEASKLSRAKTGNVVLFFYAPWCPTCKTVNTDIKNNLKDLPSDLSLLTVDYDSSTELKKKYGVTYQHTFVQVDEDGNMLKKWSGGSTLQSILAQVN